MQKGNEEKTRKNTKDMHQNIIMEISGKKKFESTN